MLPSEVKMECSRGYRNEIYEGWKKLNAATILGEEYKIDFYRLSERTIELFCDALNGWYNVWTKFRCEYSDRKGKLVIIVRKPEDADKLFRILSDITPITFEHEGTMSAVDVARNKMETLINLIRDGRKEKNAV